MKIFVVALLILASSIAAAGPIDAKVEAAMAAEGRPQADVDRDRNRMPVQTLKFFGLRDDMKIVELMPGGGWYTRILAPVLAENGQLYVALGTGRVRDNIAPLPGFEHIDQPHWFKEGAGRSPEDFGLAAARALIDSRSPEPTSSSSPRGRGRGRARQFTILV